MTAHMGGPGVYREPLNTFDLQKDNVEHGRGNGSDGGDCGWGKLGLSLILFLLLPQPIKVKVEF